MTIPEMIAVMQAFERDGKVQFRKLGDDKPWSTVNFPVWNFDEFEYRAMPKRLEGWVNIYDEQPRSSCLYATKELADSNAGSHRIRCVLLREVDNPATFTTD